MNGEQPTGLLNVSQAIDHDHLDISLDVFKRLYGDLAFQTGHGLPKQVFWSDIEQRADDLREGRIKR